MSWLQDNFISRFFVTVITWLYSLTGSWVLAVIIFTVVVRLLLLPLDIKQRHTTMKQGALAGKVQEIQRRYKNDPRMAQAKTNELYKREGVKLSAGCLPMLLQLPIIFAMFGAITILSNTETGKAGSGAGKRLGKPAAVCPVGTQHLAAGYRHGCGHAERAGICHYFAANCSAVVSGCIGPGADPFKQCGA